MLSQGLWWKRTSACFPLASSLSLILQRHLSLSLTLVEQVWCASIIQWHAGPSSWDGSVASNWTISCRDPLLCCAISQMYVVEPFPLPFDISKMPLDMLTDIVIFAKAVYNSCFPYRLLHKCWRPFSPYMKMTSVRLHKENNSALKVFIRISLE